MGKCTTIFCRSLFLLTALLIPHLSPAQDVSTDSLKPLPEVVVQAYERNRPARELPAALGRLDRNALERSAPMSLVPAMNTIAGVRMEERSPGSYRLNIRGSSLRSPFGVRNVKIYFNDIPFTDPGGHSYLNSLGFYNFRSLELVRGPGSSLYGAGTGGVLLIRSLQTGDQPGLQAGYTTGSFGLQHYHGTISTGKANYLSKIGFEHQQSDGYRDQSELRRDVLSWTGLFQPDSNRSLSASFLYSDLFYETPGALTRLEFEANPKASRPAAGSAPGALAARAAIHQRSFLAGISYEQQLAKDLKNRSTVYAAYTQLINPNIRNYSRSTEPHVGGRTIFKWAPGRFSIDAGAEWQQGFAMATIHKNRNGNPDTLQSVDETSVRQSLLFAQASLDLHNWLLTAGLSVNDMKIKFHHFMPAPVSEQQRFINDQFAPRLALMRRLGTCNLYAGISKGFSPPSSSELLPTGSAINTVLQAEEGINYDAGLKGTFFKNLDADVNVFWFALNNAIVQRRDAAGGDYFVNAGKTRQRGMETMLQYDLGKFAARRLSGKAWLSHTWHRFQYVRFQQVNANYDGRKMPGTSPHVIASGIDIRSTNGIMAALTYYFGDRLPLNDANDAYAPAYHLLGLKIGYQRTFGKNLQAKIFAGADNLLDERYSLGNDINGFGGRYYNAAPERNFYLTILFSTLK